jgi:hypothetical protein
MLRVAVVVLHDESGLNDGPADRLVLDGRKDESGP